MFLVLFAATLATSLVACSLKKDSGKSKEKTGTTTTTAVMQGAEKYAVVLKTQSSQFWQDMKSGIEIKAKELGVTVDIQSGNTEDDVEGQVQVLENFISTGKYKAIGVAPISDVNLNNAIAEG